MVPISTFTEDGVDVGAGSRNMNYLYGLADFFSYVFEDTETVNVLLESNSLQASEIYSKFLQVSSSLSLAGIQTNTGSTIKLLLVQESDKVGSSTLYKINQPLVFAKFLSNRPFLPTETLEEGVDFRITQNDSDSCFIRFARPLSEYKFSKRPTTNNEDEYALWATDVVLDDSLMYKSYGKILGVLPEVSSDQFSNFVYGLYYLYLNGPTLSVLEKGLNLVLGIPLVRDSGVVLDIRFNVLTNQYIIITDTDQYILPVGINPNVSIDDIVTVGTSLAKWVELKDHVSDGSWWLNVSIPESIIRGFPGNQIDRFAKPGSNFDMLMSKYLYANTFLVRINIGSFQGNKYFNYLSDILYNAKPLHAQPVYVWKLDMGGDELATVVELSFDVTQIQSVMLNINSTPIDQNFIN
jgi:hypothetical protein